MYISWIFKVRYECVGVLARPNRNYSDHIYLVLVFKISEFCSSLRSSPNGSDPIYVEIVPAVFPTTFNVYFKVI